MPHLEPTTIRELLSWAYANLAMAHSALSAGVDKYGPVHFMVRARLYKGLRTGAMNLGSLLDDERVKMVAPVGCAYCGCSGRLTIDHLIPTARGGPDTADNTVWACATCNSSKGAADMLRWWATKRDGQLPPILLVRRYLKLAFQLAEAAGVLDRARSEAGELPFDVTSIPGKFPPPSGLRLWATQPQIGEAAS